MAFATSSLAILELGLGNYEAAVAALLPAWTDDSPLVGTRALPDLIEAAVRAGRQPLAAQALARFDERARATGTPLALGLLARSAALLVAPDQARETYEEALELLRPTGAGPQIARAHLLYGEWLRRQRRRREARDQLRTAHEMFEALRLDAFAERARVELRATGEHAQRRQPGPSGDAHPAGSTDRHPGQPGAGQPGHRHAAVHQPQHGGVPPAQGVPEARRHLADPARPPGHRHGSTPVPLVSASRPAARAAQP